MSRTQKSITATGYSTLVKQIQTELSDLDFFVKRRTAESYWKVGKFIHEHLLENKNRADYGHYLFERLEKDVNRDESTLRRILQFYRAYPIHGLARELTWGHYQRLIGVRDVNERKQIERRAIQKGWGSRQLRDYLSERHQILEQKDDHRPVAQLKFTRGKAGICAVIKEEGKESNPFLDLGFRMRIFLPEGKKMRLNDGDVVSVSQKDGEWVAEKTGAPKDSLYTYKAEVGKVVDGDTLWVVIDAGFDVFIEQKLRLRGMNCFEIDTPEGKAAKKFVEARLKPRDAILIKTHKDSVDKYDRYLADIFYGNEEKFLNQELLDARLAVVY